MKLASTPLAKAEAERLAGLAWAAYAALVKAEKVDPSLVANDYWQVLKDAAHARFRAIFESEALR